MAANKHAGKKSLAQNDFLAPAAPLIGTATNVGTGRAYNNGAATVTFTAQGPNSADSYTVTSSPGGFTASGASSPLTVTGLLSSTNYSFAVTASNTYGTSQSSSASNTITATTVPDVPGNVSASSPGAGYDTISWTAPADGGSAITNYHVTGNDGTFADTTATSVNISQGMGEQQSYTVYATNANGNSATSASTALVTTTFSFAPFGAFGFSPFGFSPFGFSPFGFSPFGFSPFRCIAENTEVATLRNGKVVLVKAKDLAVGMMVFSPTWEEYSNNDDPYNSRVEYSAITNRQLTNGVISKITTKPVEQTIIINNNPEKHYSLTQPVLARKVDGLDAWEFTKDLEIGDTIWEYSFEDKEFKEITITDLEVIDGNETVYALSINNTHTFIAGGVISHNKL